MAYFQMFWAIPMMLAWGAYTQLLTSSDAPFRVELSSRLESLSGVTPVIQAKVCANPACAQRLPEEAQFCTRCGHRVGAE
jgi:hypothetical protein